ncbi:hypothetical protein MAHJHV55_54960 [Mycobacterium avium subsp. hominissuis]
MAYWQWNAAFGGIHCQYAMQFIAVLRGYALPVDQASTGVLRQAAASHSSTLRLTFMTCPGIRCGRCR